MRRLAPLALLLLAGPALAAGSEASPPAGTPPGTGVEMPFLIAPLNEDGKLASYAYISTRLGAASEPDAIEVRNKIAFIQDAFVRDVNGAPVTGPDPKSVDVPALEARLLADARRIVGARAVKYIHVTAVQIAPLHPKETPQLSAAPPAEPAPPPPGG